jgi:hypothetical protein
MGEPQTFDDWATYMAGRWTHGNSLVLEFSDRLHPLLDSRQDTPIG